MPIRKHILPIVDATQGAADSNAEEELRYSGGPLLTSVQVYTIFWGAAWAQPEQSELIPKVNAFFDGILTSSLMDLLAEYSVAGQTIGWGSRVGTNTITATEPGGSTQAIADAEIQTQLQMWIGSQTIPPPNKNTLYFVYMPPNVTVTSAQGDVSGKTMCGYHWWCAGNNPQFCYAVMAFPCNGCHGFQYNLLPNLESLTSGSSHEMCEAITDPQPWSGWGGAEGEIGDVCSWQTGVVGGFTVQQEWSNAQGACVLAPISGWTLQQINLGGMTTGPAAVRVPSSFVFNDQSHILYPDIGGTLWDSYWDGSKNQWVLQRINQGGVTNGPPIVGNPTWIVEGNTSHIMYRDSSGIIWHAYYVLHDGWHKQQINQGGVTNGAAAVGDPYAFFFNTQSHILYRDNAGYIRDSYWDGTKSVWVLQQINQGGGVTNAPAAVGDPSAFVYADQSHIIYCAGDGVIWDAYYVLHDGWHKQQINQGGRTNGPAAACNPSSFVFNTQAHILYCDTVGELWDSYWDGTKSEWVLQRINQGGVTNGPAAVGAPTSYVYNDQSHIFYRDANGTIWDAYYQLHSGWYLQRINFGGRTTGVATVGDPSPFVYNSQQHILYIDGAGTIWDSYH